MDLSACRHTDGFKHYFQPDSFSFAAQLLYLQIGVLICLVGNPGNPIVGKSQYVYMTIGTPFHETYSLLIVVSILCKIYVIIKNNYRHGFASVTGIAK